MYCEKGTLYRRVYFHGKNIKLGRDYIVQVFSNFDKTFENNFERFYKNGSKACAWLIYKSAAALTARLTPRRHPLAVLAGAEAKRTPQRTNKPKTEPKARRRRGIAAEPLGDGRAHLSPRFCYVTFGSRAITSLSLDCPMYSPSIQHPKSSKSMNFLPSSP